MPVAERPVVRQKERGMTEQANETLRTIHSLRSTRGNFSDREIGAADLQTILGATVRAANAANAQNYAIVVSDDRALMQETFGMQSPASLLFCVDLQRNTDLAAHVGCTYEYDPVWALTTVTVDVAFAAQTAAIAARSLGIDSLLTNVIHRGDPRRVWKAFDLPPRNCYPVILLLLGYARTAAGARSGRLGAHGTIHQGQYHHRTASELDQLAAYQSDAANGLWEPKAFFEGPGKRAKTAYAQLSAALAEAGFGLPAAISEHGQRVEPKH